jgi:hypothetical protein
VVEIGPNLLTLMLAVVGILSILAQSYAGQKHAEQTQRLTNGIAAETIQAQTAALSTVAAAHQALLPPPKLDI